MRGGRGQEERRHEVLYHNCRLSSTSDQSGRTLAGYFTQSNQSKVKCHMAYNLPVEMCPLGVVRHDGTVEWYGKPFGGPLEAVSPRIGKTMDRMQ